MATTSQQATIQAFLESRFPDQYLISVQEFARVCGDSYGAVRNRISAGTFETPVFRKGSRNFVAIPDVVEYLISLHEASREDVQAKVPAEQTTKASDSTGDGSTKRSKYGADAKARAAASKAKRQAAAAKARAAKAKTTGEVAA